MEIIKTFGKYSVSPILGIIFMVIILSIMCVIMYYYVTCIIPHTNIDDFINEAYMEGWISESYIENTIEINGETINIWHITFCNDYLKPTENNTYSMFFINGISAPPTGVKIRCYYEMYEHISNGQTKETYYKVYRVKSL